MTDSRLKTTGVHRAAAVAGLTLTELQRQSTAELFTQIDGIHEKMPQSIHSLEEHQIKHFIVS